MLDDQHETVTDEFSLNHTQLICVNAALPHNCNVTVMNTIENMMFNE